MILKPRPVDLASEGHRQSLAEIALAAGFADQAHLTRHFHRAFGQTPGHWRQQNREGVIRKASRFYSKQNSIFPVLFKTQDYQPDNIGASLKNYPSAKLS